MTAHVENSLANKVQEARNNGISIAPMLSVRVGSKAIEFYQSVFEPLCCTD
jgi:hypothetical protein